MTPSVRLAAALSLLLATLPVAADTQVGDCDYRFEYDVTLAPEQVRMQDGTRRTIEIRGDALSIDGAPQALTEAERARLVEFRLGLEALGPQVATLALEGATLGLEAAIMALDMLSGDPGKAETLRERMAPALARLRAELDGRTLRRGELGTDSLSAELEAEIEGIAHSTARGVAGSALGLAWDALFNAEEVAARAERVDRVVSASIEPRAEAIEQRADALCHQMRALDRLENRLGRFNALSGGGVEV